MAAFNLAFVLIFSLLKIVYQQGLYVVHKPDVEDEGDTVSFTEINKTDSAVGISLFNEGLSYQNLTDLHLLAKNVSYSKGIYRHDEDTKSHNENEIRRSILKKIAISTESSIIKELLHSLKFRKADKLKVLEQMEDLVHQYDVAVSFASLGGIEAIAPLLLSSEDRIASYAACVLGAAMQGNPNVQKLAVQLDVGQNLLTQLSHKSPAVLSKIIFALGSFLRNLPEAQESFFRLNGVSKLAEILKMHTISTNTKLRIINIFSDLSVEQQMAKIHPSERSLESIQKLEMLFIIEVQTSDICALIPSFLYLEDLDTHQKVVAAMISLCSTCLKDFANEKVNTRIKKLIKLYDPDSNGEGPIYPHIDNDLKRTMHNELKLLLKEINKTNNSVAEFIYLKSEF